MKRYWEIDTLRGCAIICMILFHSVYLLVFLQLASLNLFYGFWWLFPRCIAASFLALAGVSLALSYSRAKTKLTGRQMLVKFMLRGLLIFGFGMIITLVTFVAPGMEDRFVLFGILHVIGVSIIAGFFLVRFPVASLVLGLLMIVAGIGLGKVRFPFYWFLWLGLRPENYYPVDYLPILPWGGFVFIGIFAGNLLYKNGERVFPFPELGTWPVFRFLQFLGRHSLVIYLVHIPLIYGIIFAIRMIIVK